MLFEKKVLDEMFSYFISTFSAFDGTKTVRIFHNFQNNFSFLSTKSVVPRVTRILTDNEGN